MPEHALAIVKLCAGILTINSFVAHITACLCATTWNVSTTEHCWQCHDINKALPWTWSLRLRPASGWPRWASVRCPGPWPPTRSGRGWASCRESRWRTARSGNSCYRLNNDGRFGPLKSICFVAFDKADKVKVGSSLTLVGQTKTMTSLGKMKKIVLSYEHALA